MAEQDNKTQQPAGAQPTAAPQQQQVRPCPQDCRQCGMNQQIYCSTQMIFNMSRTVQEMRQKTALLELALDDIKEQVQPKQEEAQLSIPFAE